QLNGPYDAAVGLSGTIYVADRYNHRIEEYDSNGGFLGTFASGDMAPTGLAVDVNGNVYATDAGNYITKYGSSGEALLVFGSQGNAPGLLNGPAGIVVDGVGNIYVADHGNSMVQKFSPGGSLLSYWGTFGTGPGQFDRTLDVSIGPDGAIYVSD